MLNNGKMYYQRIVRATCTQEHFDDYGCSVGGGGGGGGGGGDVKGSRALAAGDGEA